MRASGFLSTPSARRATQGSAACRITGIISIHALREEGDRNGLCSYQNASAISIHALREEGDLVLPAHPNVLVLFLSTPSARRATSGANKYL